MSMKRAPSSMCRVSFFFFPQLAIAGIPATAIRQEGKGRVLNPSGVPFGEMGPRNASTPPPAAREVALALPRIYSARPRQGRRPGDHQPTEDLFPTLRVGLLRVDPLEVIAGDPVPHPAALGCGRFSLAAAAPCAGFISPRGPGGAAPAGHAPGAPETGARTGGHLSWRGPQWEWGAPRDPREPFSARSCRPCLFCPQRLEAELKAWSHPTQK